MSFMSLGKNLREAEESQSYIKMDFEVHDKIFEEIEKCANSEWVVWRMRDNHRDAFVDFQEIPKLIEELERIILVSKKKGIVKILMKIQKVCVVAKDKVISDGIDLTVAPVENWIQAALPTATFPTISSPRISSNFSVILILNIYHLGSTRLILDVPVSEGIQIFDDACGAGD